MLEFFPWNVMSIWALFQFNFSPSLSRFVFTKLRNLFHHHLASIHVRGKKLAILTSLMHCAFDRTVKIDKQTTCSLNPLRGVTAPKKNTEKNEWKNPPKGRKAESAVDSVHYWAISIDCLTCKLISGVDFFALMISINYGDAVSLSERQKITLNLLPTNFGYNCSVCDRQASKINNSTEPKMVERINAWEIEEQWFWDWVRCWCSHFKHWDGWEAGTQTSKLKCLRSFRRSLYLVRLWWKTLNLFRATKWKWNFFRKNARQQNVRDETQFTHNINV